MDTKKDTQYIGCRISPDLKAWINVRAAKERRSLSNWLVGLIERERKNERTVDGKTMA